MKEKTIRAEKIPELPKQKSKRKTSQLSECGTGTSSLPNKKKIKQTQINYKQGGKSNVHTPPKRRPKSPSRILSSDYGEDGFNDLPSPSTFLEAAGPSIACVGSSNVGLPQSKEVEQMFIDPSVLSLPGPNALEKVDTIIRPITPTATSSEHDAGRSHPLLQPETVNEWDSAMSDYTPATMTSPLAVKSSATSVLLDISPSNANRSPKGKEKAIDISDEGLEQPIIDQYPLMNTLHEILSVPSAMARSTSNGGDEHPVDEWEDIDRMLYEEYKNIVNFY